MENRTIMKQNILTLLTVLGLTAIATAQITVTSATFPQPGDTLKTAVDALPENIEITAAGGGQTWDYSNLSAPFEAIDIYRPASEGSVFDDVPEADVFFETAQAGESYFNVTDDKFELIAVNGGGGQIGIDFASLIRFSPPLIQRQTLIFPQQDISNSSMKITVATEDLPQVILDLLSSFPLQPDSIRVNSETERVDFVDAWGSMTIPGGTYDVLRQKRTETNDIKVEALVPILGWQDVTGFIAPFLEDLGNAETVTYRYFNDVEKEPIAVVTADSTGTMASQVVFKSNDIVNSVSSVQNTIPNIYAYPNPAIFDTRFEFTNLKEGNYKLKIFNILGVSVWEQRYFVNGSRTVKVDLNDFRKGTYLYSLENSKGKTLMTKRLMVVRP